MFQKQAAINTVITTINSVDFKGTKTRDDSELGPFKL